jgi:molybdate/tungstate transport system ATP-binding protein
VIEIQSLRRRWGDFLLKDIDLTIQANEYFVILGPCGSGKTLLLETIAGLYSLEQGRIAINGRDVTRLNPEKRRISLVYQQYALFPHLSVRDNIGYGLRYQKLTRGKRTHRIDEMIELLGIQDIAQRNSPNALSGGEAQKVALARALATRPDALLLDEPLSSLDPLARERVIDILGTISSQLSVPIVHVTHDYSEATALADRLGIMESGTLAQVGSVHDVFRHPASRFVAEFIGVENVIDCTLEQIQDGHCIACVGEARLAVEDDIPDAQSVCLCIRPDDIRLHLDAPDAPNVLEAAVREVRHEGFSVRIQARCDSADVVLIVPEALFTEQAVTVGMTVYLELPPNRLHLMRKEALGHAA